MENIETKVDGNETKKIGLGFGCLCEPISKQLEEQGFKFNSEKISVFEKEVDAINQLRFGDLLTDSMIDKIVPKLYKKIVQHVAKENKLFFKKIIKMTDKELLQKCKLQLEYLNQKFPATGTTNSLLVKITNALQTNEINFENKNLSEYSMNNKVSADEVYSTDEYGNRFCNKCKKIDLECSCEYASIVNESNYEDLNKEITRLQEKYDENGYECEPIIKLQRIENHIDSTINMYRQGIVNESKESVGMRWVKASEIKEINYPICIKLDGGGASFYTTVCSMGELLSLTSKFNSLEEILYLDES